MSFNILEINDNDLTAKPSPECAHVKEFEAVITRDKSKNKVNAVRELAFIYHLADYNSPYGQYIDNDVRMEAIAKDIMPSGWKPDTIVMEAVDKYKELKQTLYTHLLISAEMGIHKLETYFEIVDLTETNNQGKPVWSASELVKNISNLAEVVKGHASLQELIKKEETEVNKNRKQVAINIFSE